MATLIFKLKGVPEEEADAIRQLLEENNIDFYETPPSIWGVSMEAIWIKEDAQVEQAKQLIATYQQQLQQQVREEYEALAREGKQPTLWRKLKEDPLQFIVFMLIIAAILYLSVKPFLSLGH